MNVTDHAVVLRVTKMNESLRQLASRVRRNGAPLLLIPLAFATGCHWAVAFAGEMHGESGVQICENDYDACMADAQDGFDRDWCEFERDFCLAECPEWEGDDGGYGTDGDGGGPSGTGGGEGGDGDGDGGGDDGGNQPPEEEIPEVCFDLHASCIDQAETLQDVEACEALFEHCADPGECEHDCPNSGCPQGELDECLDGYSACTDQADTQGELDACEASFDVCVEGFDSSQCLPEDDGRLEECLEEHALCVQCGVTPEHFEACKEVFDACMGPIE